MFIHIIKGKNAYIHRSVKSYGINRVGDCSMVMENVILGYPTSDIFLRLRDEQEDIEDLDYEGCRVGYNTIVRAGSALYKDTILGHHVRTGHNVLIREKCVVGDYVLIGTNVVIDSNTIIGSRVSIQSSVYIPAGAFIGDHVFLGPNCVLLNDKYPVRIKDAPLAAPIIRNGATIGGNATLLPGVEVGEGAMVAASAVVTKDVPPWHLAFGAPAQFRELEKELCEYNHIL